MAAPAPRTNPDLAGNPPTEGSIGIRAYRRELPGGGYVAIDVQPTRSGWWRQALFEGQVVVERRAGWRDGEHPSPVIARGTGPSVEDVVQLLLPAAQCNETVGAALLRINPVASCESRRSFLSRRATTR